MSDISDAMGGDFDTKSVPAAEGFDPIPAGWYAVEIEEAKVVPTKSKNGYMLSMKMVVLDGQYKGRKLFPRINIQNPNAKCQEIGHREMASLGQALGLTTIKDSSQLLGAPLQAKVKVKQDEGFDPSNEVTAYKAIGNTESAAKPEVKPMKAEDDQSKTPAPVAANTAKRPWER